MVNESTLPLAGVRIIECGVWHAGPGASAILGDLGADVIKIESLSGEPERNFKNLGSVNVDSHDRENWSVLYEITNRNKRGLSMDMASEDGRVIVKTLIEGADVFVTNYRRSTIEKLGMTYGELARINPRLIHLTVSGYGEKGPLADVGGFDPMGQAISGMAYLTGSDEPVILQMIILDQLTAITASHALMTALFERERGGVGQSLHVSLYGSAIWALYANIVGTSAMNSNLQTAWNRKTALPLRNCYKCADGRWIIGTNHPEEKYWDNFIKCLSIEDKIDENGFQDKGVRSLNNSEVIALIDKAMLKKNAADWLSDFKDAGISFVPVQNLFDVLEDEQARVNSYIQEVEHPIMGKVRLPGYPVKFGRNHTSNRPAPEQGEHSDQILGEIGIPSEKIAALRAANIIR